MRVGSLFVAGILILGAGCGSDEGLTSASGTVTLDGAPLAGATVEFHPQSPTGIDGVAETNTEGKYEIRTFQGKRGSLPGSYKVVVTKKELPPGYDPEKGAYDPMKLKELVPAPYFDPEKTTLTATVEAGKTHDFTLKGAAKK